VEALVRALGFGPRDEADPGAGADTAAEPAAGETAAADAVTTADTIAAGRRDILERLARHELSAEDAAEAIRALGRTR
jgi:hypothetical protein